MKVVLLALASTLAGVTLSSAQGAPPPKTYLGGSPRVSPDGAHILFGSNRSGTGQIYVMKADGSDLRQLTHVATGAHGGQWSPDGRRIVFETSDSSGMVGRILIMNADGTSPRVVDEARGNQAPSWSHDGSKILFASGTFPNINIYTMNLYGTDRRNISPNPGFDYDPVWSPDGKQIAFVVGTRGEGVRVNVMNADGTGRRRVSADAVNEERPTWSRDGKLLAYQASTRGQTPTRAYVYVADLSTGTTRRVTNPEGAQLDETPSWFPDGKRLAIQSDRDGTWSVYVIDLNGTTLARLTMP
ncbi:MAG: hypothetical protein V4550_20300 [Gemmatimonadota bacterium]